MLDRYGQLLTAMGVACGLLVTDATGDGPAYQYQFGNVSIPLAKPDEPRRSESSMGLAADYLDDGAAAWIGTRKCVSCHTDGAYMLARPALTPYAGAPAEPVRRFYVSSLMQLKGTERVQIQKGIQPASVVYVAAGLAEWDRHVRRSLSPETEEALRLMFDVQLPNGAWFVPNCWPPTESSSYQKATVAAMAVVTAPGWLGSLKDRKLLDAFEKVKRYLQTTPPPHDHGRTLLLWASTRVPGLLDDAQKQELIEMLWRHQRDDGGWSIRTFAAPEEWGAGNRAGELKAESDFDDPPSDGHQTGLAIVVLRDAGVPVDDPRIQRAVAWLRTNQRASGRWWTRSLNRDRLHFITYSGTCYAMLALAKCGVLTDLADAQ